jgi:NodT family efflux transporter outer membrane factor (OMF) lipoprotein
MSSLIDPRLAVVGGALLALCGCVAGPQFVVPPAPAVDRYQPAAQVTGGGPAVDSSASAPEQWWTLLQAPRLDAVVALALADNQDLSAAQATLAQAQALARVSTGARYPRVDLQASAGRRKNGAADLGDLQLPAFTYYSIGPSVSYLFDIAGGVRRGVEQQQALAEVRAHELDGARLTLSGNVALQALTIASLRSQIDTLGELLADDDTDVRLVRDALEAGSASRVDVLSAESQRASDAARLPPLQQQLSSANYALTLLVGRAPAEWTPPEFELAEFTLPQPLPLTLPSELAHRRPDIRAAEAQLHAATAAVGVASANLYPQLTLSANASFESTQLGSLFDRDTGGAGLGATLTAPLFNHGALRAREQAAQAAMQQSAAHYRQVVLQSFTQVAGSLDALRHNAELLDALGNAQGTAAENLSLTRQSYTEGNASVLQILTAERLHQQAQLDLVRAQAEQKVDAVQLLLALGGSALPTQPAPN